MTLENIQRFFKDNSHGMLFGAVASLIVFIMRDIQDLQAVFWISIISMLGGAFITHQFNVPRKFLSPKSFLVIMGIIAGLSFFGAQTELFAGISAKSIVGKLSKFFFGKIFGITTLSAILMTFNVFLGIISLIIGLFILGTPLAGLINTVTDNFILLVIIGGIIGIAAFAFRK